MPSLPLKLGTRRKALVGHELKLGSDITLAGNLRRSEDGGVSECSLNKDGEVLPPGLSCIFFTLQMTIGSSSLRRRSSSFE